MGDSKTATDVTDRWYASDPLMQGDGLGMVLHERNDVWYVASVLRDSPAESAGTKVGDRVDRIDDYDLRTGDALELLYEIRAESPNPCELTLERSGRALHLAAAPASIVGIFDAHGRLAGGFGGLGLCQTCTKCKLKPIGWVTCGLKIPDPLSGKKCTGRCMVA